MLRIMLTCATGVSSRNFSKKIGEEAKKMGVDCEVYSCAADTLKEELGSFDVLLIGPQMKYKLNEINSIINNKYPVVEIDTLDFNILKCDKIVNQAVEAVNTFKK